MSTETHPPATQWSLADLEKNWSGHLMSLVANKQTALSYARLRYQADLAVSYAEITGQWEEMAGSERAQTWEAMLTGVVKAQQEMLPICVRCGDCCKRGSPTLMREDLDILRAEAIPWHRLLTLRKGEPARSPFTGDVFYLPEERIKLGEVKDTHTCGFYLDKLGECDTYANRPMQCRAQACWDPEAATRLAEEPYLTRRDLFGHIGVLLEIIEEHDRRCSFEALRAHFEELKQTKGEAIQKVVDFLAYEEHFRQFSAERLNIPHNICDLVFGRPLYERVRLFGFKVETDGDGTRTLLPDKGKGIRN
ncbi:MAG: YkgJ family cysteine cluster protein [Myxococcota bacterium]|nr:YkgJ family cysteine cluster protein [Myxococcota bacterium]